MNSLSPTRTALFPARRSSNILGINSRLRCCTSGGNWSLTLYGDWYKLMLFKYNAFFTVIFESVLNFTTIGRVLSGLWAPTLCGLSILRVDSGFSIFNICFQNKLTLARQSSVTMVLLVQFAYVSVSSVGFCGGGGFSFASPLLYE
jgi:hypothetical protein